jgi:hypothetical protein
MDIDTAHDRYLGGERGIDLIGAGPFSQRVYEASQHETATTPLIAAIFWQIFQANYLVPYMRRST